MIWPHRTPEDWKLTCAPDGSGERLCKIPDICKTMAKEIDAQAGRYHDRLSGPDGKMKLHLFLSRPVREMQDAMLGPFVHDQVVSIFKGWTGGDNEEGYKVEGKEGDTQAQGEEDDDEDEDDEGDANPALGMAAARDET